jgi:hypothetical protein
LQTKATEFKSSEGKTFHENLWESGGMEPAILTSGLVGVNRRFHALAALSPRKRVPITYCMRDQWTAEPDWTLWTELPWIKPGSSIPIAIATELSRLKLPSLGSRCWLPFLLVPRRLWDAPCSRFLELSWAYKTLELNYLNTYCSKAVRTACVDVKSRVNWKLY